jgi:Ca2+-binding RTX toxin-like protein
VSPPILLRLLVASLTPALVVSTLTLATLSGSPVGLSSAPVTCAGRQATIVGTPGPDRLVGTGGPDVIAGLGGNDLIDGRGGDDVLCGGPGGDRIAGGPGDDWLVSGPPAAAGGDHFGPADVLEGGSGDDQYVAAGSRPRKNAVVLSFANSPTPVSVDLREGLALGWGDDTIAARTWVTVVGSAHDDVLKGTAGRDWLQGRAGDDTIDGRAGDDRLEDGSGDDTVIGGPGDDSFFALVGHDTVHGGRGDDDVFAFDRRADHIYGGDGDDVVDSPVPVSADQAIDGGTGRDRAFVHWRRMVDGKPAFTRVATDQIAGTWTFTDQGVWFPFAGFERLEADGMGTWTATGTAGDDVYVTGWETRLIASMGDGDDTVTGSRRGDTVDGGPGTDAIRPFGGRDVCVSFERFPRGPCESTG